MPAPPSAPWRSRCRATSSTCATRSPSGWGSRSESGRPWRSGRARASSAWPWRSAARCTVPFVRGRQLRLPLPKAWRWRTAPALARRPARATLLGRELAPAAPGAPGPERRPRADRGVLRPVRDRPVRARAGGRRGPGPARLRGQGRRPARASTAVACPALDAGDRAIGAGHGAPDDRRAGGRGRRLDRDRRRELRGRPRARLRRALPGRRPPGAGGPRRWRPGRSTWSRSWSRSPSRRPARWRGRSAEIATPTTASATARTCSGSPRPRRACCARSAGSRSAICPRARCAAGSAARPRSTTPKWRARSSRGSSTTSRRRARRCWSPTTRAACFTSGAPPTREGLRLRVAHVAEILAEGLRNDG